MKSLESNNINKLPCFSKVCYKYGMEFYLHNQKENLWKAEQKIIKKSENGLITNYSCSNILKIKQKITILFWSVLGNVPVVPKETTCIENSSLNILYQLRLK